MTPPAHPRRPLWKATVALTTGLLLLGGSRPSPSDEAPGPRSSPPDEAPGPLFAYVGTFSSPLRDVLPTQVDLPPGNGRGIHLFRVDRGTGGMTAAGVHEMGTSPSHLA